MFFCDFSESFLNTTGDYFLFFRSLPENISRYYTKRIKWGNIGDFNANTEHVFDYYNNFGGRHPE